MLICIQVKTKQQYKVNKKGKVIFMREAILKKGALVLAVFVFTVFGGLLISGSVQAKAATKCYTIGNANVQVYSNTGLSRKYGTIYPSDEITVHTVTDRYCKVTYPISRGTKTGYISTGKILTRTMGSSYTSRAKITTYRRVGGSSYGYIAKGDFVKVLGASGSYTQVKYPVSGGYKYAFIKTSELNAYILPQSAGAGSSTGTVFNGTYKLVSLLNENFVMDVKNGSSTNGANIQLYKDNGSNAQKFRFSYQPDGYYIITNISSGKAVDCAGAGREYGTNIQLYEQNSSSAQRWKLTSVGDGYYTLTCKCNGLLMDVKDARVMSNTNIQMFKSNGSAAQRWKLVPVSDSTSAASSSNLAQRIVNYELSQVGTGDYRGNNNVKYNTWYYGRTVSGNGYAWCMAFQSYCANQLGVLNTAVPKTASCAVAVDWYKNRGRFQYSRYYGGSYTPKAGDLVFYYNGSFCHVGMITAAPVGGYLQTVEGNIQCSDGNWKVVTFTRNSKRTVNNSYVYGYGTPGY